jgi:hypothetical protein
MVLSGWSHCQHMGGLRSVVDATRVRAIGDRPAGTAGSCPQLPIHPQATTTYLKDDVLEGESKERSVVSRGSGELHLQILRDAYALEGPALSRREPWQGRRRVDHLGLGHVVGLTVGG